MQLDDLKIGDFIYISKTKSDYKHMIQCKYLGLKKGRIWGEIINVDPQWAEGYYYGIEEITCNKNKCSIYKEDKK